MTTFDTLPLEILEEILLLGEGHIPSFLATKKCNALCPAVWHRIAKNEQYSLLSMIQNAALLVDLFTKWGKPVQDWCQTEDISIHRHLIHETCQHDKRLGLLILELTDGSAYDLMPLCLQDDTDIIDTALEHSNGYVFCVLREKHRTNPDILFKFSQLFCRSQQHDGFFLICQNHVARKLVHYLKVMISILKDRRLYDDRMKLFEAEKATDADEAADDAAYVDEKKNDIDAMPDGPEKEEEEANIKLWKELREELRGLREETRETMINDMGPYPENQNLEKQWNEGVYPVPEGPDGFRSVFGRWCTLPTWFREVAHHYLRPQPTRISYISEDITIRVIRYHQILLMKIEELQGKIKIETTQYRRSRDKRLQRELKRLEWGLHC